MKLDAEGAERFLRDVEDFGQIRRLVVEWDWTHNKYRRNWEEVRLLGDVTGMGGILMDTVLEGERSPNVRMIRADKCYVRVKVNHYNSAR